MKLFNRRYWAIWVAVFTFLLTQVCSRFPNITENLFSQHFYPVVSILLSFLFRFIPFSITDLFYVFIILFILVSLILWVLRRIELKKALYIIIILIAISYTLFYWFWGFNYFRQPLEKRIALKPVTISKELFYKSLTLQIEATNNSYIQAFDLSSKEVDSVLVISYQQLKNKLALPNHFGYPVTKTMTFSRFFAGNSISGYFGPFGNEVHINNYLLPVQFPMILAHEKAHQLGITSEAEASFNGWMACLESKHPEMVYSANLFILMQFNKQEKMLFDSIDIFPLLKPEVAADYLAIREFWKKMRYEKIERISSVLYDNYLKSNNVTSGIQDYQGVVSLIITYQNQTSSNAPIELNK